MGVGAPLIVVAIGSVLCFVVGCVVVVVLCLWGLRQGNHQFEGEIKAPSLTIRIKRGPLLGRSMQRAIAAPQTNSTLRLAVIDVTARRAGYRP
jgi:hypothetical protein